MRFFNTEGPIDPLKHYFVPRRLNDPKVKQLIDLEKYFILHAPRQSGKTTAIRMLADQLKINGKFKVFYINVEAAQAARSNVIDGLRTILSRFRSGIIDYFGDADPAVEYLQREVNNVTLAGNSLYDFLQFWARSSDKPLVIFIDEIDSLVGDTLISVLRQLRDGYTSRPKAFPQSVCLVGVRDVRDYKIWSDKEQKTIQGGSAFNIKSDSLVLLNFSLEQIQDLYLQHTKETGQKFTEEAVSYAYYLTQGQPWLVNALAFQACFRDYTDRSITITKEIIEEAKEKLIQRRDTHIDVLIDRLQEPRVAKIIDAIINGEAESLNVSIDDIQYVIDLGLIVERDKDLKIANPIYQEIIPRELAHVMQRTIVQKTIWYQNADGSLNMHKLMESFQQFYREHSEIWVENNVYKESAPHIIMMAFLQRIINGGGKIYREYALGRKRMDILIEWPFANGLQRIVIEIKILRGDQSITKGLEQTAQYLDTVNANEGYLLIVDKTPNKPWSDKIFNEQQKMNKYTIGIWGV